MKVLSNSLLLAMVLGGSIATATASSVIQSITASGAGLGSFSDVKGLGELDLSKTFSSVNSITLTFTVAHGEASGTTFDVKERMTNGTTSPFTGFHLQITEAVGAPANGAVFTTFNPDDEFGPDFLPWFTLDPPSQAQSTPFQPTGPRDLNFTGELAAGSTSVSFFNLSMPDPGAGNTYTFTLTQTPTIGVVPVPEPETYALMLAGLGLVGFMTRCRKQNA